MTLAGRFNGLMSFQRPRLAVERILTRAYEYGIRCFDTAPAYCRGYAEEMLGDFAGDKDLKLWTKVGVDINGVLPQRDYSYSGLWRGLEGSLHRLRREYVDMAFLHNPPVNISWLSDYQRFSSEALRQGVIRCSGVSVLHHQHISTVLRAMPEARLMVEAQVITDHLCQRLATDERSRLIVRSIFGGGAFFAEHENDTGHKMAILQTRVESIVARSGCDAIVIAPRTMRQLHDYRWLVGSINVRKG